MPDIFQVINHHRNKFFIIGIAAFIVIFGYLLYFLFFREAIPEQIFKKPGDPGLAGKLPGAQDGQGQITHGTSSIGQLPDSYKQTASETAAGGLTKTKSVIAEKASGVAMANGKDLKYYNKNDGKFYKAGANGENIPMDDKVFHKVDKITWAKRGNVAILEYPDGANIVYDFDAKRQTTLPSHWQNYDISEDNLIVMKSIGYDPSNRWLAVSDLEGSEVFPIEFLGNNANKVIPRWSPSKQVAALYIEGDGFNRQQVYFVGLQHENFKSLAIDGRGFDFQWSPDGARLLYSVYSSDSNFKPSLWLVNAQGDFAGTGKMPLNINTWVNKCAFANAEEVYCAVPEFLPEGAGLFPEFALESRDNIYQINLKTNQKSLVAVPFGNYNISSLMLSSNGGELYFTDITTEQVFNIRLK
jgi:hypothetical protein